MNAVYNAAEPERAVRLPGEPDVARGRVRLILLTDVDGNFHLSMPDLVHYTSMDTAKLASLFAEYGFSVQVMKFHELRITRDLAGIYVLYQSSEKRGPFYKNYIEDIIYALELVGAIPVPRFSCLKAHHNKVFMELLRGVYGGPAFVSLDSRGFGCVEEAEAGIPERLPVVIKASAGAGSEGVYLARNEHEYRRYVRKVGHVAFGPTWARVAWSGLKAGLRRVLAQVLPRYRTRDPEIGASMVVQQFVAGLDGDYKVLFFGGKYYLLYRRNRENDFRASGGGRLSEVPEAARAGLLAFARTCVTAIDSPVIGLDVGFDGKNYHLFEFQMVHLGPYTLQAARCWYELVDGAWLRRDGRSDLETEFARSIAEYINGHHPE
jgi:hypothetical protein